MYKKVWWATRVFFAYETSCLFGDLAAIAVAIAKTSWSTCNGASYQELPFLQLQLQMRLELTLFWYNHSCFIMQNLLLLC